MDGVQLRDEAAQDRVRAAVEFLDPSKHDHTGLLIAWSLIANLYFFLSRCESAKVRGHLIDPPFPE